MLTIWGYSFYLEWLEDFVCKPMVDCSKEILLELQFSRDQIVQYAIIIQMIQPLSTSLLARELPCNRQLLVLAITTNLALDEPFT